MNPWGGDIPKVLYSYERYRQSSLVDSWGFRWFVLWFVSALLIVALGERGIGMVDALVLPILLLVVQIARLACLFLFLRLFFVTARRALIFVGGRLASIRN